jgi:branched-chain amino acid transport system ATP-binding protein
MPAPAADLTDLEAGQTTPVLELIDVHAGYGRVEVLHGVNLAVPRGSVLALMGANGAGKTTLLNVAAGVVRPASGCVHVAGMHMNGVSTDLLARAGVCSVPEGRGAFPNLTVNENLRVYSYAGSVAYREMKERAFRQFPVLGRRQDQLAGTLSGGERQMLSICRAFVTEPALLLVDEISMGLAPLVVRELYEVIGQLAQSGMSVLLVEQFAKMALEVADYAAVMRLGRIEAAGRPADVSDALAEVYLGGKT